MVDRTSMARRRVRTPQALVAALLMATVSLLGVGPSTVDRVAVAAEPSFGIDTSDPDAVAAAWQKIITETGSLGFTGNVSSCVAGTTSASVRARQLAATNALRSLVGVRPATENVAWSAQAQKTALMMAAAGALSHYPGPSWPCHTADGAEGAASSNLFLYQNGVEAMWGYIADWGANNVVVGHRRWMLCPTAVEFGFGDTPTSNATKVFGDRPRGEEASRDGFVAWPNPGLVPVNLAEPRGLLDRFSVQIPSQYSPANASVTVTSSSGGSVPVTVVARSSENMCGPAVVFEPSRLPQAGETWTIRVTGLTDGGDVVDAIQYQSSFVVLGTHDAFITAAYTDFLGRAPKPQELASENAALDGGAPRTDLIQRLSKSSEWISHIVTDLYVDTLGRLPDSGGLAYWTDIIATGRASVAKVASQFYASSEYFTTIGGGTITSWVDDLYVKILGRPADAGGRSYWVATTQRSGRGAVAFAMFQSQESRQTRVTGLYEALLGRRPDHGGLLYWAGKLRTQGDLALAVNLAGSSEYAARARTRFP